MTGLEDRAVDNVVTTPGNQENDRPTITRMTDVNAGCVPVRVFVWEGLKHEARVGVWK